MSRKQGEKMGEQTTAFVRCPLCDHHRVIPLPTGEPLACPLCGGTLEIIERDPAVSSICSCGESICDGDLFCKRCGAPAIHETTKPEKEPVVEAPASPSAAPPEKVEPPQPPPIHARSENLTADTAPCRVPVNRKAFNKQIQRLAQLPSGTGLAEELVRDMFDSDFRSVRLTTVHRLSVWCHPKQQGRDVQRQMRIARQISEILFGCVVARRLHWSEHRGGVARQGQLREIVVGLVFILIMFLWIVRGC